MQNESEKKLSKYNDPADKRLMKKQQTKIIIEGATVSYYSPLDVPCYRFNYATYIG